MAQLITVHKLDHNGQPIFEYSGIEILRGEHSCVIEARFGRGDISTAYHTFKRGDRMVEWFYNNRWYNIFELHHRGDDRLEGWYCNITRPARFEENAIYADDLALDLMVYPDGQTVVLDENEFLQLDIDEESRHQAQAALQELLRLVTERWGPFAAIGS